MTGTVKTLAALLVAFLPAAALATTMVYLTTEDMTLKADDIVRAEVISMESKADKNNNIFTYTKFKALEWIKDGGDKPGTFTLRQRGGQDVNL